MEIRKDGERMRSLLHYPDGAKKDFDYIKYYHGRALDENLPTCVVKFEGFEQATKDFVIGPFSNGLVVEVVRDWVIHQQSVPNAPFPPPPVPPQAPAPPLAGAPKFFCENCDAYMSNDDKIIEGEQTGCSEHEWKAVPLPLLPFSPLCSLFSCCIY